MSLISYQDVRPWARAISKEDRRRRDAAVACGRARRHVLERAEADGRGEIDARTRGRLAARPRATRRICKPPPMFAEGWRIGTPDAIFEMQEDYPVPASGTIEYEHFYIPTNFTEAKWLKAIEARPGNRALVHHILVYYEAPPDGPRVAPAVQPNREHSRIEQPQSAGQPAAAQHRSPGPPAGDVCARHRRAGLSRRARRCASRLAGCFTCRCTTPPTAPRAPIAARSA